MRHTFHARFMGWALLALLAPSQGARALEDGDRAPCLRECQAAAEACMREAGDDAEKQSACASAALSCIEACGVTLPQ